jgi:hypothetical protein
MIEMLEKQIGLKYDADKPRWDLVPYDALSDVVKVLTVGAAKYGDYNWMHVENAQQRYFAAAQRHLVAHQLGFINDSETGLPHLAHAACCILFMLSLDKS